MAYHSQSLGRSLSVTSLEGIQVRLGERFKPPEKIALPPGYKEPNPSAILNATQYSFETERSLLQFLDAKRASDAAREAREKQAREEQRAAAASPVHLPNGILQPTAAKTVAPSEPPNHALPSMASLGGDIMTPVPLASAGKPGGGGRRLPAPAPPRGRDFDLADFESNASDPFESTELETINDMEELRSVLAFTHTPAQPGSVTTEQPLHSPDHSHDVEVDSCTPALIETATVSIRASDELVAYKPDRPKPPSKPQMSAGTNGPNQPPEGQANRDPVRRTAEDNPDPFVRNPLPPISSTFNDLVFSTGDSGPARLIARGPAADHSVPPLRNRSPPPSYESQDFTPASSSVVSPIDLPPSYPQNLSRYTPLPPSPHQSRTNSMDPGPAPLHPDPVWDGMNSEDRNFVLTIASMGFPRSRTSRAVRELGHDDRLVVEWLCAVDHLCCKGFPEDKVELALSLQNSDLNKAEEFLLLCQRFEELGFKSEDVRRELIVHGNNEDAVLNVLTAKS